MCIKYTLTQALPSSLVRTRSTSGTLLRKNDVEMLPVPLVINSNNVTSSG